MEEEKKLTEAESLALISGMIHSAKENMGTNGIHYMIWGWGVFVASLLHYLLLKAGYAQAGMVWLVLMPLCGVLAYIAARNFRRQKTFTTYVESFLGYLWVAFGISLFVVLSFAGQIGFNIVYPFIIILYGIGTFVSGGALKFWPLKIGGILCWIIAVVAIRVGFEYQLLLIAVSVLISYIVPGYLLRNKYQLQKRVNAGLQ